MNAAPRPPVVVDDEATALVDREVVAGRRVRTGFDFAGTSWDLGPGRWICVGSIQDEDDAVAAVTALVRGVALAVRIEVEGDLRLRFLEDLHELGRITTLEDLAEATAWLGDDQERLMDALSDGDTVTAAAKRVGLSRRSASRRLAEVRSLLGVDSTAEAIVVWRSARSQVG